MKSSVVTILGQHAKSIVPELALLRTLHRGLNPVARRQSRITCMPMLRNLPFFPLNWEKKWQMETSTKARARMMNLTTWAFAKIGVQYYSNKSLNKKSLRL